MRGATVRLKAAEFLKKARAARTKESLLRAVEEFIEGLVNDKRRRRTPELDARVRTLGAEDKTVTEIEMETELSAPTIRKILREPVE